MALQTIFRQMIWVVAPAVAFAADLPIREVVLFKNGIGYFERSGELPAGETARLDFKAGDMNDVLKSLTVTDSGGARIGSIRYDASEPLDKRLEDFPFKPGDQLSLAVFLDQMKGARLELQIGGQTIAGSIVSARQIPATEKEAERETALLLLDSGEMRTFDLAAASGVRFTDAKLQSSLKEYLAVLNQAHSKDLRSVYIDAQGAPGSLTARYTIPSPVWKSTYRLMFGGESPVIEGWAIVDNTTGEDWSNVHLSVVSGKPISFITQLYQPKYIERRDVELAENKSVAPTVFGGPVQSSMAAIAQAAPPLPMNGRGVAGGFLTPLAEKAVPGSSIAEAASQEEGELFAYNFSNPVTVKRGESAMLPFLQQKIGARKLLVYMQSYGLHPMDAAEITNNTGKTLDGGPFTIYDGANYSGEAIAETIQSGDKRLISYGVDLGTRVTTLFDSSRDMVRELHFHRGVLSTRSAIEETETYTIRNVDAKSKTLIIEHAERRGYKLLNQTPVETTASAYRFQVQLAASGTGTFPVKEERLYDQSYSVSDMTPDVIAVWIQNKALSDAGRRQLEAIAAKKREIAANDAAIKRNDGDIGDLTQDEARVRDNIARLNGVSGQQELVQQYARQLSANEARLVALRDTQTKLRHQRTALESELDSLMENTDF